MPNEGCLKQFQSLCYLILLLDSVGSEVNYATVAAFWEQSLKQPALSSEIVESVVFFWGQARKPEKPQQIFASPPLAQEPKEPAQKMAKTPETKITDSPEKLKTKFTEPVPFEEPKKKVDPSCRAPELTAALAAENPNEAPETSGRYIYGIILGTTGFHGIGIDGQPVYPIFYQDIGALVHSCPPKAYASTEPEQVETWLRQHQNVVDAALLENKSLIPMSFDVIIDGGSAAAPDEVLRKWLQERYPSIKQMLEYLSGRVEYGIKISCSVDALTEKVTQNNPEIIELSDRLASMSKGTAFLYKSELAHQIRSAVEEESHALARIVIAAIRPLAVELKENKTESEISADNERSVVNLAILAEPEQSRVIGDVLEDLQHQYGLSVRFTGPWPAYSFVKDLE